MTEIVDLLDDPETVQLDPTLTDFNFSGEAWVLVEDQKWSWKNGPWKNEVPPITPRLRAKLQPVEIAHFERKPYLRHLIVHASRKMGWQPIGGWTSEDVAMDALAVVLPLGFEVGGASWVKLTRRVMNNRISKLLEAQSDRVNPSRGVVETPHLDSVEPKYVPQVFSDAFRERLSVALTPRELEAVAYAYEADLSGDEIADRMGIAHSTVRVLLNTARERLSKHFEGVNV